MDCLSSQLLYLGTHRAWLDQHYSQRVEEYRPAYSYLPANENLMENLVEGGQHYRYYCSYLAIITIHTLDNEGLQTKKMFDVSARLMILIANGIAFGYQ